MQAWRKPFLRIGHGGAGRHAPPNTLGSLQLALEMDVDVVEFDVRACRDGLVLNHDAVVSGPGAASTVLAERTLAELRRAGVGPEGGIVSLCEALDLVRGRALVNLDLKAGGCEEAVLRWSD